jgi:hypothetical protein
LFLVLEARCGGGYTDAEVVAAAWDFAAINQGYADYLAFAGGEGSQGRRRALQREDPLLFLRREREAWAVAVAPDPLLPRALWPPGYLGPKAWDMRQTILTARADS